jgi:hypothetical protein
MATLMLRAQRRKGLIVVLVAAMAALFLISLAAGVFDSWRYGVPPTFLLVNQERSRLAVQQLSGLKLPVEAKVLVASGDGTEKSAHWVIYAPVSIENLPFDKGLSDFVQPRLMENVRIINNAIAPYKVPKPTAITFHSWPHGSVDNRGVVVFAENGRYMLLQTFWDD